MVEEQKKIINHYINDLQPDFKSVLVMFYYGNMKAEDIAKSLNIPLGTVNSRIARARNMLREKVKQEFELS
jgi:RNA polymerase sigma-70 factor (ECF subfamily)